MKQRCDRFIDPRSRTGNGITPRAIAVRGGRLVAFAAALALLAPVAARAADAQYKIQPIVKLGEKMGDIALKDGINELTIGGLNDSGQIVFSTQLAEAPDGAALIQYSEGKFT